MLTVAAVRPGESIPLVDSQWSPVEYISSVCTRIFEITLTLQGFKYLSGIFLDKRRPTLHSHLLSDDAKTLLAKQPDTTLPGTIVHRPRVASAASHVVCQQQYQLMAHENYDPRNPAASRPEYRPTLQR